MTWESEKNEFLEPTISVFILIISITQIGFAQVGIDSIRFFSLRWYRESVISINPWGFNPENSVNYSNVITDTNDIIVIKTILKKLKKSDRPTIDSRMKCIAYSKGEVVKTFIVGSDFMVFMNNQVYKKEKSLQQIFAKYFPEKHFPLKKQNRFCHFFSLLILRIKFLF